MKVKSPEILSPAGDKECFFAAISAGADAIYVGLKEFSAREKATNFSIQELISLQEFANSKGVKVYVALNVMVLQKELDKLFYYLDVLHNHVRPNGLIVQDIGIVNLCKDNNFDFDFHLSTLSNISLPSSFNFLKKLGIKRVVLPREFTIDEIKYLAKCSNGIGLEVFIHGALCYGVSGRCYWSSMLGGRSGLRGRCVQPCRRTYTTETGKKGRFFSCRDLGLDVLIKLLLDIPQVVSFKIEGRKKGPHYVYYITKAYKLLRDNIRDSKAKKMALELIDMALGRKTTHYFFLSHRRYSPIEPDEESASGIKVGKISLNKNKAYFRPYINLLAGDRLRISYEDQKAHNIITVNTFVKKGKKYFVKHVPQNTPVFLIDRKEPELVREINGLKGEWLKIKKAVVRPKKRISIKPCLKKNISYREETLIFYQNKLSAMGLRPLEPQKIKNKKNKLIENQKGALINQSSPEIYLVLVRSLKDIKRKKRGKTGIWLYSPESDNILSLPKDTWIWIDPVIWPGDEDKWKIAVAHLISRGFKFFILNSTYHIGLIDTKKAHVWLGPFANIANSKALGLAKKMGFKGVIVSPELKKEEYFELVKFSPLPLGVFIKGVWPYTISRIKCKDLPLQTKIYSPRKEELYIDRFGENYYVFPDFQVDLRKQIKEFKKAGYKLFLEIFSD